MTQSCKEIVRENIKKGILFSEEALLIQAEGAAERASFDMVGEPVVYNNPKEDPIERSHWKIGFYLEDQYRKILPPDVF